MSCDTPPGSAPKCSFRFPRTVLLVVAIAALIAADGSRCRPADPTKPINWRGDAALASQSPVLRVATFNIHSGRGRDRKTDLSRTAGVFTTSPDIVGLNEVRGTFNDSLKPDQAAQLGELLGMRHAFVATERRWWHDHFGNAVLTKIPIRQTHRIPLPGTRGKAFRNAVLVQFEFQERHVQLLTVHIDSQSDRELQLQAIISLFEGLESPAILMGDLNSNRDDPLIRNLLAQSDVVDVLAQASRKADSRPPIDWILTRGFQCRAAELIDNDASDHPLAVAELELELEPEP